MSMTTKKHSQLTSLLAGLVLAGGIASSNAADKRIVLISGPPSHGPGDHEHRAGCLLLQRCLNQVPGVHADVFTNGWPNDLKAFEGASAVIVYSDGGDGHPFLQNGRLKTIGEAIQAKAGFGCLHYAVEVPKNRGGKEFLDWIGGYYETFWSVNPTWLADFKALPAHPVARGVKPFKIQDEWYYHMRFRENMKGVTPILTAVPPDDTRKGADDAHGGNKFVRADLGKPEHVMWVSERPDGGRGFGFTGGHFHQNWGDDNFRKVVLNAILWAAKVEVPENGLDSTVTADDLRLNLDKNK
jgi:type 1 glutamine amidotransferase